MDSGLILDEQVIFRLRRGVGLDVDLKAMGRFQGLLRGRINGPFDVIILRFMNCRQQVKIALAELLFPIACY